VNIELLINVTIWLFNIAMENCPFIDGLPMAMLNNQRVIAPELIFHKIAISIHQSILDFYICSGF
jgi:hypothetical protein